MHSRRHNNYIKSTCIPIRSLTLTYIGNAEGVQRKPSIHAGCKAIHLVIIQSMQTKYVLSMHETNRVSTLQPSHLNNNCTVQYYYILYTLVYSQVHTKEYAKNSQHVCKGVYKGVGGRGILVQCTYKLSPRNYHNLYKVYS